MGLVGAGCCRLGLIRVGWLVGCGGGGWNWVVNDMYIGIDNCSNFDNLDGIGTMKQLKEKLKPSRD